jgi:uncharacterized membrane protein
MKRFIGWIMCPVIATVMYSAAGSGGGRKGDDAVSFKSDIYPIIQKRCLPCHAEDNSNPSELSLDSYADLMQGGKHGVPVIPRNSGESLLMRKLSPDAPFGDQMPLDRKKKKGEPSAKALTADELRLIGTWIDQGAQDN